MELDRKDQQNQTTAADLSAASSPNSASPLTESKGAAILAADLNTNLDQNLANSPAKSVTNAPATGLDESKPMGTCQNAGTALCTCSANRQSASPSGSQPDEHDHTPKNFGQITHVSMEAAQSGRSLDGSQIRRTSAVKLGSRAIASRGDILDPGGGTNTVISGRGSDVILGTGRGFNTITTGTGRDAIVLGQETTNRIFDFDAANDFLVLGDGITFNDISIQQGTNANRAGVNQPTDNVANTLIIDKRNGHVLASLTFTKADTITEKNFRQIDAGQVQALTNDNPIVSRAFRTQRGGGQLNGTARVSDRLISGTGNDFLFLGDDGFRFETARGGGGTEFPFATDSPGTSEVTTELKNGVMKLTGSYRNFDAAPLFSQGETTIDPKARILNGSNPQALVNGFLAVERDSEGNARTGTHLHFSPAGDDRGNFADATVVRFMKNTPTDAKSGTISGEFRLTPEEQAALLAGNIYVNIHTNMDVDGDGKAGFPTGENRINLNKNVVKFI